MSVRCHAESGRLLRVLWSWHTPTINTFGGQRAQPPQTARIVVVLPALSHPKTPKVRSFSLCTRRTEKGSRAIRAPHLPAKSRQVPHQRDHPHHCTKHQFQRGMNCKFSLPLIWASPRRSGGPKGVTQGSSPLDAHAVNVVVCCVEVFNRSLFSAILKCCSQSTIIMKMLYEYTIWCSNVGCFQLNS